MAIHPEGSLRLYYQQYELSPSGNHGNVSISRQGIQKKYYQFQQYQVSFHQEKTIESTLTTEPHFSCTNP